jgi:hypothetical protein
MNKKIYGHYSVEELPDQNGKWGGYRCQVVDSGLKQGKLYPKSDGHQYYQQKKDEELEI